MSFGSYPCPNNVWNHTTGCACVPNGSMTSEVTDIDLTPAPADVPITAEMVATYLGDGPDLNEDEQRILGILLDPRNHRDTGYNGVDGEVMLEEVNSMGEGTDDYSVTQIAGLLDAHYAREAHDADPEDYRAGTMAFNISSESESYTVDVYLGSKMGGDYLSSHHDSKYLDPERYFTDDTSGLRRAIHHARTIDENFQSIRAKAIRLGLIKNPRLDSREQELRAALRAAHVPSYLTDRQAKVEEIERFIATARPYIAQGQAGTASEHEVRDAISNAVDVPLAPPDHIARVREQRTEKVMAALRQAGVTFGDPAPKKSPWPETDDEKVAFVDWQNEAANGDTNASFRDWYENPDRNMNDED